MRARTHLIRLQRTLYNRLKDYGRELLGGLSPELKKYFVEYQKDFHDFKEVSTKRELLAALLNSHVAFCGDYHTLAQAQRTVIRLLRDSLKGLAERRQNLVLALEMVRARDNVLIARFLAGKIEEEDFLQAIAFYRNWGFSWRNYRTLFHFARENKIRVVGLNYARAGKAPTLTQRDRFAAQQIAKLNEEDPNALVFVLMGDLHLAEAHLPRQLRLQWDKKKLKRKMLIIHQNHERFYWKLVARGLEQRVDVVKVKEGVYCVMNTPPWVKLHSHLKWAEVVAEGGSKKESFFEPDHHSEEIVDLVRMIQSFVGLDRLPSEDFEVVREGGRTLVRRAAATRGYSVFAVKVLAQCLKEFKSLFIPANKLIYLSDANPNHAASQAAIYVHSKVSGFQRLFSEPAADFYPFVWVEALGFLGSKVLNHKRKCNGPRDLERLVRGRRGQNVLAAEAALAHWRAEQAHFNGGGPKFKGIRLPVRTQRPRRAVYYYKVAKLLGQLLGEALYTAVVENKVSREELRGLFGQDFPSGPSARRLYLSWAERLDGYGYRHIAKTERL